MTSSAEQHRERLATVSRTLQSVLPVPTDTYITEDIPLLLTKLSRIPSRRNVSDDR
ncbi:hypothetical protein [Sphingomonas sp. Leaf37]|uniref:hypothetical protein n=1 Tax=Sphingomonas sp. Leaf37 TaxID=2876552 RepID=UPI001E35A71E|nr:hypothetical protein [Sphingomonas sp. Leaf37]